MNRKMGNRRAVRFHLEPLEQRLLLTMDFGDAPFPFPTTIEQNGASHDAVGPRLGALRTTEDDASPTASADSDLGDDGVTFVRLIPGRADNEVTVEVNAAPDGAWLNIWLDISRDHNWGGGIHEHIVRDLPVQDGLNTAFFSLPSGVASGDVFARARVSTVPRLGIVGHAPDGEVEDLLVSINSPAMPSPYFLSPRALYASEHLQAINPMVDFDQDGDFDIPISGAWLRNERESVVEQTTQLGNDLFFLTNANGNQLTDAALWNGGLRELGSDGTIDSFPFSVPASPRGFLDWNQDGLDDYLAYSNGELLRYVNAGDGNFDFASETIVAGSAPNNRPVSVADLNGDGHLDVVTSGATELAWFEWQPDTSSYVEHSLLDFAGSLVQIAVCDLSGDGTPDIVAAIKLNSGDVEIVWFEAMNDGFHMHELARHEFTFDFSITDNIFAVGDLEGNGRLDLVMAGESTIWWYRNAGQGQFSSHTVWQNRWPTTEVFLLDFDNDDDLDLVAFESGRIGRHIVLYENFAMPDGELDFGDAPENFPTSLERRGAAHIAIGPRLGASRDGEDVPAVDPLASGDMGDDGVVFGEIRPGRATNIVEVDVQNAPDGAYVDVWLDTNHDRHWGGALERVVRQQFLTEGTHQLEFATPASLAAGTTFARARISSEPHLSYGGIAFDGEVEDYLVEIVPPTAADARLVQRQPLVQSLPENVTPVDFDQDGDIDLVSASRSNVYWFENTDGAANFRSHALDLGFGERQFAAVEDYNQDGILDVCGSGTSVGWALSDGNGGFETGRYEDDTFGFGAVFAGDVDSLGMHCGVTKGGGNVLEFSEFETTLVSLVPHFSHSESNVFLDVDLDGDLDMLFAPDQRAVVFAENLGGGQYAVHEDFLPLPNGRAMTVADMNSDGLADIIVGYGGLRWYENQGDGSYLEHIVELVGTGAALRAVAAGDIDGDGDMDLISAGRRPNQTYFSENDGQGGFTSVVISGRGIQHHAAGIADLDGDGDLDVVSNVRLSNHVIWHENISMDAELDFGDAPDRYGTTVAESAAAHYALGPRLGDLRDFEFDGQPTDDATGDGDDEDGVLLPAVTMPGTDVTLTLELQEAAIAFASAWVDFNQNFSFDPDEQILDNVEIPAGSSDHAFAIPATAAVGTTFVRVRVSSLPITSPFGLADDGEVEDHQLLVAGIPQVENVAWNAEQQDPPSLPDAEQPSSWQQQQSELRTITVTFSEPVLFQPTDFQLTNLGVNTDVDPDVDVPLLAEQFATDGAEVTISFGPRELADGVYRLTLHPTIVGLGNQPLDGNGDGLGGDAFVLEGSEAEPLYVLTGDWSGDGGSTIFDFATFAYWFGSQVPAAPEYVDLNGDGGISAFDLPAFVDIFGTAIQFPAAVARAPKPREHQVAAIEDTALAEETDSDHVLFDWPRLFRDRALLGKLEQWL